MDVLRPRIFFASLALLALALAWVAAGHGSGRPGGRPPAGRGGGDWAPARDTKNRLYFTDLQALNDVSNSVTADHGATWNTTCNSTNTPAAVDRPWIAAYRDPQLGGAF